MIFPVVPIFGFILSTSICGIHSSTYGNRIVGGVNADAGQFKFIASLRHNDRHFCGGSIVNKRFILTAAHCKIYPVESSAALVGTNKQQTGGKRYGFVYFLIHEKYDPETLSNDIAVIKVAEDICFGDLVQPIDYARHDIAGDVRVVAAGWGLTSYPAKKTPEDLQWVYTYTVSTDQCSMLVNQSVSDTQLCTLKKKGEGVCSGDSGGPLIDSGNSLVGVASAAYLCARGLPDYFTRVYSFVDWIDEHIKLESS